MVWGWKTSLTTWALLAIASSTSPRSYLVVLSRFFLPGWTSGASGFIASSGSVTGSSTS